MRTVVVTGSGGLIGAQTVRWASSWADLVIGVDNDMRSYFFGGEASTRWAVAELEDALDNYVHVDADVRDRGAIADLLADHSSDIELVVHTAAQPSHDWAAQDPFTDFDVNAGGTLNMLEATRRNCPTATFIFTSTNKVYGDSPNRLPLVETQTRWTVDDSHPWAEHGIPEDMSLDHTTHSIFGASKVAADVMVQEYGRYFGMNTGVFRGGCLTGPGHSGTPLHGFLAYLMKCTATGRPYTVLGYRGKQVRDNIHAHDLVRAFEAFHSSPRPGEAYNIGGGPGVNCSMIEAIDICQQIAGRELQYTYTDEHRIGDHIWWVSDIRKFRRHYPAWDLGFDIEGILQDIYDHGLTRWDEER